MEPMFNEGQKCIIEFVADDGSQVWFKTRVNRIERGLAVLDIADDLCAVTVWFPNMDGAWNVDGLRPQGRYRIWSKDNEQARAGLAASKLFARLCEALGPFESAVHRAGATIDVLAAKHAGELKARIRKVEVMAEALEAEVDDVLSWLTYPAKTNDSKMTRRQVAQYLVGKRVQYDRAGLGCTVEDVARLSGITPEHVRGFEWWATGITGWPGCPCMTRDDFMRRYAEQVGGVEMLDRIAR
jgi:hypothetical protein